MARPPKGIVLNMDSSVSPTHGEHENSVWNGHYACTCYHPLFRYTTCYQSASVLMLLLVGVSFYGLVAHRLGAASCGLVVTVFVWIVLQLWIFSDIFRLSKRLRQIETEVNDLEHVSPKLKSMGFDGIHRAFWIGNSAGIDSPLGGGRCRRSILLIFEVG